MRAIVPSLPVRGKSPKVPSEFALSLSVWRERPVKLERAGGVDKRKHPVGVLAEKKICSRSVSPERAARLSKVILAEKDAQIVRFFKALLL